MAFLGWQQRPKVKGSVERHLLVVVVECLYGIVRGALASGSLAVLASEGAVHLNKANVEIRQVDPLRACVLS